LGCAHLFRPTYAGANVGHPSDFLWLDCADDVNAMNFGSLHPLGGCATFDFVHPAAPIAARIMNGLLACCCR
jgi:hypothetical protein